MTHFKTLPILAPCPEALALSVELLVDVKAGGDVTTSRPLAVPITENRGCIHKLVGSPNPLLEELVLELPPSPKKSPPNTLFLTISETSRTGDKLNMPIIDETEEEEEDDDDKGEFCVELFPILPALRRMLL